MRDHQHNAANPHQPDQRPDVQQAGAVAHRPAHQRSRSPHHRQRRAEQQPGEPGRRRQVQEVDLGDAPATDLPVGVGRDLARAHRTGGGDRRGDGGDGDGGSDQPHAHRRQPAPTQTDQPDHHQRPQQIELLLHRQAPQMPQRRKITSRRVPLPHPDLIPVRHVPQRRQHIAPQQPQRITTKHRRVHRHPHQHGEQRRQQPPRPTQIEPPQTHRPGALVLTDQQQRDQSSH